MDRSAPRINHCFHRREALRRSACGFGGMALAALLGQSSAASDRSHAISQYHFPPRAKRVIFIFMQGGPSQVDTFDYKPRLEKDDGKKAEFDVARTRKRTAERVMKSPWRFRQYGQSGKWVSELFPHTAQIVDELCFLHGMQTEGVAHGPSTLFLHTGATNLIRPSVGSWITYGLGSENENLPGFLTISPSPTKGGPRNYGSAFLPAAYQGTAVGRAGLPLNQASVADLSNPRWTPNQQQRDLDFLRQLNETQYRRRSEHDDALEATIQSFELAQRMQLSMPPLMDFSNESEQTLRAYGIGTKETDDFGRQCLLARRCAEAGVRYVQISYAEATATPKWDQHTKIRQHAVHARATDQPVAALIQDLKQRGLLEDTLVWWGGEFGRTPFAQNSDGRDHNPKGFTVWLAGGGVQPGLSFGATDEHGYEAVEDKVHMHDLHATILALLGIDHERLTFRYAGRDFRLTDIHGRIVREIFA